MGCAIGCTHIRKRTGMHRSSWYRLRVVDPLFRRNLRAQTLAFHLVLAAVVAPSVYRSVQFYDPQSGYAVPDQEELQSTHVPADAARFVGNSPTDAAYSEYAIEAGGRAMAHSATHVQMPDGGILAFWYGGSREGAGDVSILMARFRAGPGEWGPPREIMNKTILSHALGRHIKKLGNPVGFRDAAGRVWVFFVSVSFGGWSGSAINSMVSYDDGQTFASIKRLVTSPLFNVSTLVRGSPVLMRDGSISLPVYHEFLGKFAEILHVSAEGKVLRKKRLTLGRTHIQPVLIPSNAQAADVFLRNAGEGGGYAQGSLRPHA